jgi:hypothetical protein
LEAVAMVNPSDEGTRSDGFLSRWARRKQDVLAGKPVAEPVLPEKKANLKTVNNLDGLSQASVVHANQAVAQSNLAQAATENIANENPAEQKVAPPALTLDDASALTPASDFKPFMARSVSPEVKNAAMKKLFADPHYNVMDMMDTYVDDYSKSDPIPESMLRELASAKFLRLFERDEEEEEEEGGVKQGQTVATAQAPALADEAVQAPAQTALQAEPALALTPETSDSDILQAQTPITAQPLAQPITKTL